MSPTGRVKMLVAANVIVVFVGSVDAGLSREWDLFVLFLASLVLGVALMLRLESRRPAVPIRKDLVAWLRDRASVSGESIGAVTDRAIATFADRYGAVVNVEDAHQ